MGWGHSGRALHQTLLQPRAPLSVLSSQHRPHVKFGHKIYQYAQGKPNDIQITTIDARRWLKSWMLDTVCTRFVHRIAAGNIGGNLLVAVTPHQHRSDAACAAHLALAIYEVADRHACHDVMPAPAQAQQ